MYTYFKMQVLSSKLKLNNFALKAKLYVKAIQASFAELQSLKGIVATY